MIEQDLVYIDQFGILGSNFYWHKYAAKGLTKEDILAAGLTDDRVRVHTSIVEPLLAANRAFRTQGHQIYLKEGYRSKSLYEIVYAQRVEKFGKEETDRLLNMEGMPHAKGTSVDVALWSLKDNTEVYLRDGKDGIDALFVDFYKDRTDEVSKNYQHLQEWLIDVMQGQGFRLGSKREYFHFDYRPDTPKNYPTES